MKIIVLNEQGHRHSCMLNVVLKERNTMECIIATTDFSSNAKAGLRFAIKMAQAMNARLVFLHVHYVLRASFWSDKTYEGYLAKNHNVLMDDLASFVKSVYHDMKLPASGYELSVYHHLDVAEGIIAYASSQQATFLCISRNGAGRLQHLFGSTISKLIRTSHIAVISVPAAYRTRTVSSVLYASDMTDYLDELKRVVEFARPLKATLNMVHLSHPYEFMPDTDLLIRSMEEKVDYPIHFHTWTRDTELSIADEISAIATKIKPDVIALFTDQHLSVIDRIFKASSTKEYSFHSTVPLLSFNKSVSAAGDLA
jgi:nucleotide-binding universal stress UspA family protein